MMETRLYPIWLSVFMGFLNFLDNGLAGTEHGQQLSEACDSSIKIPCVLLFDKKRANCYMTNITCVPGDLPNDLSSLSLSINNLEHLYNNSFQRYTNLEELYLSQNDIRFIATAALYPLKKLQILDLRFNRNLKSFSSDLFRYSKNLVDLLLTDCRISPVPHDIFRWLPQLQSITLMNNLISSLNITFCPTVKIEDANLMANSIHMLTMKTFIFPCKIQSLQLQYNPINFLESEVIESLSTIHIFVGSKGVNITDLMQVYSNLFKGVSQSSMIEGLALLFFDVKAASTFRDLGNKSLSNVFLGYLTNFNYITDGYVFQNLPNTQELIVEFGKLRVVRPLFFDGMNELLELYLVSCTIYLIDWHSSSWNISLHTFNLKGNALSYIDRNTFRGLDTLRYLDLSDNRFLRHFSVELLKVLGKSVGG